MAIAFVFPVEVKYGMPHTSAAGKEIEDQSVCICGKRNK